MKYEELFTHYYTMVYRLSLLLLKNKHDAEDAAMTIFLRVMEKNPDFADDDHTRAWLITATRNYCKDIQRSSWYKWRIDMEQLPEQPVEPFVEPFDKQESLLFEIFQSLPKKQREVVYLYYFEDYSIKEIGQLLERNESTVQSQLFAARNRMKKQFSTSKAAALIVALAVFVSFGTMVADAASGGRFVASIKEFFKIGLTEKEQKISDETLTLPVEVYASELSAIDENYIVLSNERGLLIYDRENNMIISALDLQELGCNYFNANTLVTRVFLDDGKLYFFNDHVESTDNERFYNKRNVTVSMPEFAYIFDLSVLYDEDIQNYNHNLINNNSLDLVYDATAQLIRTTDKKELEDIYALWETHASDYRDTFDEFQGVEFLNENSENFDTMFYSAKSLLWRNKSGKEMLSCLTIDGNSIYKLYTKMPDGSYACEPLNLMLSDDEAQIANHMHQTGKAGHAEKNSDSEEISREKEDTEPKLLPEFVYSGNDPVMETLCAYMKEIQEDDMRNTDIEDCVYIPAPVIFGTAEDGDDLLVFCNMWGYIYYRNGNMLVFESGREAAARLRLCPDEKKAGGYKVTEDLRTGEGEEYAEGIQKFCEGYPGMAKRYSSEKYDHKDVALEMVSSYVKDNGLSIKYLKDLGWDPVPLNLDETD